MTAYQTADIVEVRHLLRQARETVDNLWIEALNEDSTAAVDLGEASMAIHRALLALTPDDGTES